MNGWMSEFRVALRSLPHQEKSLSSRVWGQTFEWGERKGEREDYIWRGVGVSQLRAQMSPALLSSFPIIKSQHGY